MALKKFIGLDVGERRVGVAVGDSGLRLAWPHGTVIVDGTEAEKLSSIFESEKVTNVVVGRPRNQSGSPTAQTKRVEDFVDRVLKPTKLPIHWQDESVTSVLAEEYLQASGKPYTKEEVDAQAAAIILQDYLGTL